MDLKGKVLLQLFNKRKLRNGTKMYLEQIFSLCIVRFKKLGFIAPLKVKQLFNECYGRVEHFCNHKS